MYCRQCEQTMKGTACNLSRGVCGKPAEVADLQDKLICALEEIALYGKELKDLGEPLPEADLAIIDGLFTTITNVNFDAGKVQALIDGTRRIKNELNSLYTKKTGKKLAQINITSRFPDTDKDIISLKEILLLGLKGMGAYASHAHILGYSDKDVNAFFYKGLSALSDTTLSADDLLGLIIEFGKVNFKCLELLDKANTTTFGHPEPTKVSIGTKKGPAIIISGHDLLDLKMLLEQTKGKGINIYTHGEMLPALAYPELKKYPHLAGHFGTAWQNQRKEFDNVPAAILMTTNCIQEPLPNYKDRIFTTGLVQFPEVVHIDEKNGTKDFGPVIKKAIELGGFKEDNITKEITIGFAGNAVMKAAGKVVELVKEGKIKHFFLLGGCDGAKPGRNYYTELAASLPQDTVILTLACGKFRFNTLDLGAIEGIPRLLDCGQCNDSYSAIKIASALASAFNCGVNDLPLSFILSWYEQKAVCVLLTLLSLGVKNIKIGPSLPAFVSENVLNILIDKFGLGAISTPEKDIAEALKK